MKKILLLSVFVFSFSMEFEPLGFKAIGMGGAGVAVAGGSNSAYYNPALLTNHKYTVEIETEAGIGMREINLINPIDKLTNNYELSKTIDVIKDHAPISGSNKKDPYRADLKIQGALNEIYKLSLGNGLTISPTASFSAQIGNFALGIYGVSEFSATANIDREHLYLIFKDDKNDGGYYYYYPEDDTYGATDKTTYQKHSLEYALDNNLTYINVKSIGLAEVPISYATSFNVPGATVSIGMNLKYIAAISYKNILSLDSDNDEIENSLNNNQKTSSNISTDIGILLSSDEISFGLIGKYLNSPKFKFYDGEKYKISPMYRGGVALEATDYLTLALDFDLTQNSTFIKDYKSQYIGGGIDFHPASWFSLRGGMMRNIVQDEEGMIFTAGLGLGLKWFQLDLAAQISDKTGVYQGNKIPRYSKVNLAIISRWGN